MWSGWRQVAELRDKGEETSAERIARRLMGVESEPMSEEAKEKLHAWSVEHKDEIATRRKMRAEKKRIAKEAIAASARKLRGRKRRRSKKLA